MAGKLSICGKRVKDTSVEKSYTRGKIYISVKDFFTVKPLISSLDFCNPVQNFELDV